MIKTVGYIRNASAWKPSGECADVFLCCTYLARNLTCCARGQDIYNADDVWIFRVIDDAFMTPVG